MWFCDRYKTELKKFALWSVWVVTCAAVQVFVDLSRTLVIVFFFHNTSDAIDVLTQDC